jgi:hypothetical protein
MSIRPTCPIPFVLHRYCLPFANPRHQFPSTHLPFLPCLVLLLRRPQDQRPLFSSALMSILWCHPQTIFSSLPQMPSRSPHSRNHRPLPLCPLPTSLRILILPHHLNQNPCRLSFRTLQLSSNSSRTSSRGWQRSSGRTPSILRRCSRRTEASWNRQARNLRRTLESCPLLA